MSTLLSRPEFQSFVIPFLAALMIASLARFIWPRVAGAGMPIGFFLAALTIAGTKFTPLTASRKIVLIGLLAALGGFIADRLITNPVIRRVCLILLGAGTLLWVIANILGRKQGLELPAITLGGMLYLGWLIWIFDTFRAEPLQAGSVTVALAFGTGIAAIMGASALLGQLGIAAAAAAGGVLLAAVIWDDLAIESVFTYPAALVTGLLGYGAVVFAKLPWFVLILLAAVPMATLVTMTEKAPRIVRAAVWTLIGFVIAGLAILLVWLLAEEPSGY